jgi:CheY-like chemotaxis protein
VNESAITLFFKNVEILKDVTEIWMSDICDSSGIWGTNNNKIVIMIRYLLSFEEMYIMKLENTVQQLNGEISSVIIDDVKCDHCIPNCQFPSWRVKYKFNFPQWVNRILIVDDAKYMCDLIKVNLKRNGIDCIVAINKEMAMDAIVNLKVDACILDANLGNESGNELELPLVAAGIPFIYYTGAPDTVSPHVNVPIVLKTTDIQEAFKKLVQVCEEKASMKAD